MSVVIEKLTDRDIRTFKRELEGYERRKRVFMIFGFIFLGITILSIVLAILFGVFAFLAGKDIDTYAGYLAMFIVLCYFSIVFAIVFSFGTAAMFILRGVLFAKKIENRLAAIEEYEIYQKEHKKDDEVVETTVI